MRTMFVGIGSLEVNVMSKLFIVIGWIFRTSLKVENRYTYTYSGTSLLRTPLGQLKMSLIVRCPHFRGSFIHFSM